MIHLEADAPTAPSHWAVMERFLIDLMNRAAPVFVERYTREDGTLVWRDEWPGMDGSDDGYESFSSFPLFYALGGSEAVHSLARRQWEAVTRQFTKYGQVYHEYDAYYDWMHHGESSQYIYYFGLADPYVSKDRERALRFADMFTGADEAAPNWDAERRMIRSPINGSRGPRYGMSGEDWVTHRPVLANYLSPYEDVPGADPADPFTAVDWNDDATFEGVLHLMNERMLPGDVPLNLNATSLVTSAFLYSGDERYRQWVLDYLAAWSERTERNGGIMPDNVGPSDEIGERMGGKWWGGYYGWRWPHGATIMLESTLIAGGNALLLTGDDSHLDLHRSQLDMLWSLGKEVDGEFRVPYRHGDGGWFDYRAPDPRYASHLCALTHADEDRARLDRHGSDRLVEARVAFGKGGQVHPEAWVAFVDGGHPEGSEQLLAATYQEISRRLGRIRHDDGDPREWDVHHWQDMNPVVCEALAQLTMGSPGAVYHGGLLHASLRYFDPIGRRAGLPEHVGALVDSVGRDVVTVSLANTDPISAHDVVVQAGSFAEHEISSIEALDPPEETAHAVDARHATIRVGPGAHARLRVGLRRHAHTPTYDFPWVRDRARSGAP